MKAYYQDEAATIYLADNREALLCLDPCDVAITDPQYGIKRDKGFEGFGGFGTPIARRRFEDDAWDAERPDKAVFDAMLARCRVALIFGGNFFADLLHKGGRRDSRSVAWIGDDFGCGEGFGTARNWHRARGALLRNRGAAAFTKSVEF